jgi:zinc/manganese transport system permease protein
MLFADRIGRRLAIGWIMGTLVSALGVYFSVLFDLPTGAAIVCTFGAVLIIMFFVHLLSRRHKIPIEDVAPATDTRQHVPQ